MTEADSREAPTRVNEWRTGTPRQLIADLRPSGNAFGHSGRLPRLISLHKTDIISDLRQAPADHSCTWKVRDPDGLGKYAKPRRSVIIWLGK